MGEHADIVPPQRIELGVAVHAASTDGDRPRRRSSCRSPPRPAPTPAWPDGSPLCSTTPTVRGWPHHYTARGRARRGGGAVVVSAAPPAQRERGARPARCSLTSCRCRSTLTATVDRRGRLGGHRRRRPDVSGAAVHRPAGGPPYSACVGHLPSRAHRWHGSWPRSPTHRSAVFGPSTLEPRPHPALRPAHPLPTHRPGRCPLGALPHADLRSAART